MQTLTIDLRTDAALKECLEVDRPVAVLAYDYPEDDRVPVHEHAKAQLIYAIEGSMVVATEQGRWVLLPHRAIWVPAHRRHAIQMRGRVRMRTAYFDASFAFAAADCAVVSVTPLLRELIVNLLDEPRAYDMQGRGGLIASLLGIEMERAKTLPMYLPWPRDARLQRICGAMQRRPAAGGDMEYWAGREQMSGRTLARRFRAELGISFQEWRLQMLVLEAQIRLAAGEQSMRVARHLGYSSHAAFCAMFRRATGITPTEQQVAIELELQS